MGGDAAQISGDELDAQLETLFDKADDLMINQKKFDEAVSNA